MDRSGPRSHARFGFRSAVTLAATALVALWGEHLLAIFGPEFVGAKIPLVIMMAAQLARAIFGPSVSLLMVIGAQRQNAGLAIAALAVLGLSNLALAPLYGVLGAAIAVAIATLFWLAASAIVLARVSGLRTDAPYLIGRLAALRSAPGLGGNGHVKLDRARLLDLLLGLLGREQSGEQEPGDEGSNREERYGGENLAEMEGHRSGKVLAEAGTVAKSTPPINLALPPLLA